MKIDETLLRRLERLNLLARRVSTEPAPGEHLSGRRGPSVEFKEHRAYVAGDDLRYVDWNVLARLEQPVVKEFAAEEEVHLTILVDGSASMRFGRPPKIESAKLVAAGLGYIALSSFDSVSLYVVRERPTELKRFLRGRLGAMEFLEAVEGIQAEGRTDLAGGFKDPLPRLKGRGMAVLVTDFYDRDGYGEGFLGLRRQRLQTHAVHLVSEDELEPKISGRTILLDLESGERRKIDVTREVVLRYRRVLDRFLGDVERKAVENGISYIRVRAREDLEGMMAEILRGARFLTVRR